MIGYLEYKIAKYKADNTSLTPVGYSWHKQQLKLLNRFLNDIRKKHGFRTPTHNHTFRVFCDKQYHDEKVVGRLYNSPSIVGLPVEIRNKLFKNLYREFDLSNSHPNIMYQYAIENQVPHVPFKGMFERFI